MQTEFNDFTQPRSQRPWERGCKKKLPMRSALSASKLFSRLCMSRLLSVGSHLQ